MDNGFLLLPKSKRATIIVRDLQRRRRKVFIAMATGWCGWLMHPYTPNYSGTTSEFDTKILVGSMRTIGFCLNGQRFAPSNVGDLPWN